MSQPISSKVLPSDSSLLLAQTPPPAKLADVKSNVAPLPPTTGTAKDLGSPITTTVSVRFGGVEGNNGVSGTGLQVGVGVKVPLSENTTLTGNASVGIYQGTSNKKPVEGTVTRVEVGLIHNLPPTGSTKWNVGVRAGVETDRPRGGSPASTSADFTVSAGFNHPLQDGATKINVFGDASLAFNLAATSQIRPRVQLGVKLTDGPFSATVAGSVQARVNLNGPNAGEVAAIIPVVSADIGYKVNEKVTVFAAGSYTLSTDRNARSSQFFGTSSNPGWSANTGIRFEF